mmetsp:Transcript_28639/g.54139  ORF Transcript_28639/g.54139 Transcript_28639/m.54139 type:complete len:86 (-) Transcript_28639:3158-3415(-)
MAAMEVRSKTGPIDSIRRSNTQTATKIPTLSMKKTIDAPSPFDWVPLTVPTLDLTLVPTHHPHRHPPPPIIILITTQEGARTPHQ